MTNSKSQLTKVDEPKEAVLLEKLENKARRQTVEGDDSEVMTKDKSQLVRGEENV